MAKKKAAPKTASLTRSPSPRGAIPMGRVKQEHCYFAWNAPPDVVLEIANAISKELEVLYQIELMQLGQN